MKTPRLSFKEFLNRRITATPREKIAADLNSDNIIPPLKYRVLYRDNFNDKGRREPQITGITQP